MTPITTRMSLRDWGLLGLLSFIWGGSFFFAKIAVAEIPPLTLVFGRVLLAAIALGLCLVALGHRLPRGAALWRLFFVMGLLNNVVPFGLLFWAQTEIASALASILNATTPLFTVLVAHVFTDDEKLSAGKVVGVLAGLAGVAVMIGPGVLTGLDRAVLAELACIAAAVSYAISGTIGRQFRTLGITPMQTAFGPLVASSVILLPLSLLVDRSLALPMPSMKALGALAGLALVSTAFAYIIFFRLMARVGVTNVALVTFLIPPSAILLGVGILGERLTMEHVAGMALIALGLSAIDGRLWRRLRPQAPASGEKASTTRS